MNGLNPVITLTVSGKPRRFELDEAGVTAGACAYYTCDFDLPRVKVYAGLALLEGGTWRVQLAALADASGEGVGISPELAMERALTALADDIDLSRENLAAIVAAVRKAVRS